MWTVSVDSAENVAAGAGYGSPWKPAKVPCYVAQYELSVTERRL